MDQPQHQPTEPPKNTSWHNSIASYMTRHIRNIHASGNEWIRIHRSSGSSGNGGGGGDGWWWLLKFIGIILLAYVVISTVIAVVEAVVNAVVAFLSVAVPVVGVILAVVLLVMWISRIK